MEGASPSSEIQYALKQQPGTQQLPGSASNWTIEVPLI